MQIMVIERRGRLHLIRGAQDRLEKMAFELSLRAWPAESPGGGSFTSTEAAREQGRSFSSPVRVKPKVVMELVGTV